MSDEENEFIVKMQKLIEEKKTIVDEINRLLQRYKALEHEQDHLETEEFVRTGSVTMSFDFNIEITERDLLEDLIKKTEGKNIDIDKPNDN